MVVTHSNRPVILIKTCCRSAHRECQVAVVHSLPCHRGRVLAMGTPALDVTYNALLSWAVHGLCVGCATVHERTLGMDAGGHRRFAV